MATIGRTFSDPDKWDENWFIKNLTVEQRYLYLYLWERCDHAGVIDVVLPVWIAHTGLELDEDKLDELVHLVNSDSERILHLGSKIWFTEYIRFNQQTDTTKGLTPNYSFHKHVLKRLKKHSLVDEVMNRDPILLHQFEGISTRETETPKSNLSLNEALPKQTGKESGSGSGTGLGSGTGTGASPYYLSKDIAERLFTSPGESKNKNIEKVNALAQTVQTTLDEDEPFGLIEHALESLEDYNVSEELTFELLEKEIKESYRVYT